MARRSSRSHAAEPANGVKYKPIDEGHAPHLQALEEIERVGILGLLEVLREEGIEGVRYALWHVSGWHRGYSPPAWRSRTTEQQKREGWEMAVRIEKIIATVLHETHGRQAEEVMDSLEEGPEGFYKSYLDRDQRNF